MNCASIDKTFRTFALNFIETYACKVSQFTMFEDKTFAICVRYNTCSFLQLPNLSVHSGSANFTHN